MYLTNCRLLPELSGGVAAEHGCVEIKDGLIAAVLPTAPEGAADVYDCGGMTLLPGLIDLHTHITIMSGVGVDAAQDPMQVMVEASAQAKRYLDYGFNALSQSRQHRPLRQLCEADDRRRGARRPDIIACGSTLMPSVESKLSNFSSIIHFCDGAEEFRRGVREEIAAQADFIKIYASGSAFLPTGVPKHPIMTREEIRTAVETAEANGRYEAAHCHADRAILDCVRSGVRTIEHATYLSEGTVEVLRETPETYLVPTFAAMFVSQTEPKARAFWLARLTPMLESCAAAIEKAYRAGEKIGFGTDSAPLSKQYEQGVEFQYRKDYCHMENIDILLQATKYSAEIAGISGRVGEIKSSLQADLVLVDGNPAEDLSVMYKRPKKVWKKGKMVV